MATLAAAAPLRHRDFRVLWAANIVSNLGSLIHTVAAAWLMLQLTGSATWVGLIVASSTLPLLFVAVPAGALADMVDRRRIVLVSQSVAALAALLMAALWFAGAVTPGRLLACGLLLGTGFSIGMPAWQALVPDLVPRDQVPGAVALNSASFNVGRAVGPAIGGLLVAAAGPGWAFTLNAVSYLGVIVAVASFRPGAAATDAGTTLGSAVALGLRYARFTVQLRWLLSVAAAFALTSAVVQTSLPNLTEERGGSALAYGLLLGAMGVGALLGAFVRPYVAQRLGGRMVPTGIVLVGIAGVLVGLAPVPALIAPGMFLAGVAWVWTLATLNATTQLLAPRWVRGRVMSLYTMAFLGVTPLGAVLAGALGDALGVPTAFVALSSLSIVLGLVVTRLPLPVLGEFDVPEPPEDFEPAVHAVAVEGGPVMVLTTWEIEEDDLAAFLEVMNRLRVVRLRTGAYRWRLYRNVEDPHRMTELYVLSSWEQHLRQHARLDQAAADVILRARGFGRNGSPTVRHLAAIDVIDPAERPDWQHLLAVHAEHHAADGSIPQEPGRAAPEPGDGPRDEVPSLGHPRDDYPSSGDPRHGQPSPGDAHHGPSPEDPRDDHPARNGRDAEAAPSLPLEAVPAGEAPGGGLGGTAPR